MKIYVGDSKTFIFWYLHTIEKKSHSKIFEKIPFIVETLILTDVSQTINYNLFMIPNSLIFTFPTKKGNFLVFAFDKEIIRFEKNGKCSKRYHSFYSVETLILTDVPQTINNHLFMIRNRLIFTFTTEKERYIE